MEHQYLQCIRDIDSRGTEECGRNGITKSLFGYSMRFSLADGVLPLLTTKKLAWRTCFKELMWFIRGSTSNTELQEAGVNIWSGNATPEFMESRGLKDKFRCEGDLGPIYGHQWRHFNAPYVSCETNYTGKGIDQLQQIIDQLRNPATRNSRRLVLSAWNPCQLDEMALPPCHILMQFHVREDKYLSCALYQRSGDVGLGVPFNIASYSLLTSLLAHHCNLIAEDFVYFLGNVHIYKEHMECLREQITREPLPFPKIIWKRKCNSIEEYQIEDLHFTEEYRHHPHIKMEMIA